MRHLAEHLAWRVELLLLSTDGETFGRKRMWPISLECDRASAKQGETFRCTPSAAVAAADGWVVREKNIKSEKIGSYWAVNLAESSFSKAVMSQTQDRYKFIHKPEVCSETEMFMGTVLILKLVFI